MRTLPTSLLIVGTDVKVVVTNAEVEEDLVDNNGRYDPARALIMLDENVVNSEQWRYLEHEIGHAVFERCGIRMKADFGVSTKQAEDIEEAICTKLLPAYLDTLRRNGLATGPRRRKAK